MTAPSMICSLGLLTMLTAGFAAAEPPIVLLKLDDVHGMHPRYLQVAEFARKEGIKINFGVFGSALEKENPEFFQWMNDLRESGSFEFWNHAYGGFGHARENEGTGLAFQREKIARTQELSRKRLGTPFQAFGPHASKVDDDTWKALAEHPEIRLVFLPVPAGRLPGVFAATNRAPFEAADLKPDLERFKRHYERTGKERDYIYIQGHPNAWKEEADFEAFKGLVGYLKEKGVRFMTISEFLQTRDTVSSGE